MGGAMKVLTRHVKRLEFDRSVGFRHLFCRNSISSWMAFSKLSSKLLRSRVLDAGAVWYGLSLAFEEASSKSGMTWNDTDMTDISRIWQIVWICLDTFQNLLRRFSRAHWGRMRQSAGQSCTAWEGFGRQVCVFCCADAVECFLSRCHCS